MTEFTYTIIEGPDINGKSRWDSEWDATGSPWGAKGFTTFHADLAEHVIAHIRRGDKVRIVDPYNRLKTIFLTETVYSSMRGAFDDRSEEEVAEVMRLASSVSKVDRVIVTDAWGCLQYDGPIPMDAT